MKRFLPFLAVVLIVAFSVAALAAQAQTPVLAFESESKDFGKVSQGVALKHVFKFANKGGAVLEIFKVEGS